MTLDSNEPRQNYELLLICDSHKNFMSHRREGDVRRGVVSVERGGLLCS